MARNQTYNEIWFAVPEDQAVFPNVAYVYNYRDNTWGLRDLEKAHRHGHFGNQPTTFDYRNWSDYDAVDWNKGRASWHLAGDQPFNDTLFAVNEGTIYNIGPTARRGACEHRAQTCPSVGTRPIRPSADLPAHRGDL